MFELPSLENVAEIHLKLNFQLTTLLWWHQTQRLLLVPGSSERDRWQVVNASGQSVRTFPGPTPALHICWNDDHSRYTLSARISISTTASFTCLLLRRIWCATSDGLHFFGPVFVDEESAHGQLSQRMPSGAASDCERCFVSYHRLACCGLDFDSSGRRLAVGDLAGNVLIWKLSGGRKHETSSGVVFRTVVPASVRCLSWLAHSHGHNDDFSESEVEDVDECVAIGCLDGSLWLWYPQSSDPEQRLVLALRCDHAINCVQWSGDSGNKGLLAIGKLSLGGATW